MGNWLPGQNANRRLKDELDAIKRAKGGQGVAVSGSNGRDGINGIDGNDGLDGQDGATILNGSGVPSAGTGSDGDYYLDTASNDFYEKAAGAWSVVGNFTGDTGLGITEQAIGFTLTGGTTPKTLTVAEDASVSGTNTGDSAGHSGLEPTVSAGTSSQYYRGDKTWQTLNQAAVEGLQTDDSPQFTALKLNTTSTGTRNKLMVGVPVTADNDAIAQITAPETAGYGDNLILNPGFETAGGGDPDFFANWTESINTGMIEQTSAEGEVHSGTYAAKLTKTGSSTTQVYQAISVTPGASYRLSFWTRGNGTLQGRYSVYDVTHSTFIQSITGTGVTSTTWTEVTYDFVAPVGCTSVRFPFYVPSTNGSTWFDDISVRQATDAGTAVGLVVQGQTTQANNLLEVQSSAGAVLASFDAGGHLGIGGNAAAGAILDLQSTTLAFMPPRMTTTQRDALTAVEGMVVYNTTSHTLDFYNGSAWKQIAGA